MSPLRTTLGLSVVLLLAGSALSGYIGGGTFVARTQFGTLVDDGGVICQGSAGDGIGGGCLPFPTDGQEGFVGVLDDAAGKAVAFQVCIDNDGDGICGGPGRADGTCADDISFSHTDDGRFFNALGPLPTSFLRGCRGGFPGYVVLLCAGAHEVEGSAHSHAVTQGKIALRPTGSGFGDFCGGGGSGGAAGPNVAAKAYRVV